MLGVNNGTEGSKSENVLHGRHSDSSFTWYNIVRLNWDVSVPFVEYMLLVMSNKSDE